MVKDTEQDVDRKLKAIADVQKGWFFGVGEPVTLNAMALARETALRLIASEGVHTVEFMVGDEGKLLIFGNHAKGYTCVECGP